MTTSCPIVTVELNSNEENGFLGGCVLRSIVIDQL